jgi:hypothetical protein
MPEILDRSFLLAWAREIGKEHPFLDFHVHPFDVLTGNIAYQTSNPSEGLYAKGSACYHVPAFDNKEEYSGGFNILQQASSSERALLLTSRLAYTHTGPKVFADHLDLVGISGALLLPVVREPGAAGNMLEAMGRMFSTDSRFLLGCPFPVETPCNELLNFFRWARDIWGVRVIKIHSNLINVDPFGRTGQDIMEATLVAAGSLNLSIVLHGGRTPGLEPIEKREYGTLSHLERVNWGLSSAPVIFAHAGCYGLADEELPSALKVLDGLLEKYPNIMADTSNLGLSTLQKLLTSVDCSRLVFGSDALYIPVWKAWLRFLQTLQLVSASPDDDLIRIASLNPAGCLSLSAAS